jgi:predicted Mrr-cat superfamily restriction endonuclease
MNEGKDQSGRVWVVRAGQGAAYAADFLGTGRVAIGFNVHEDITAWTWEQLSACVTEAMPDAVPVAVGLAVGALFRLANEFDVGDFVLTPERGGNLLAGEICGPYAFDANPELEDYSHTRAVRWFARIPRSTLPEDMKRTLGSIMTLFQPGLQNELIELLTARSSGDVPGPSPVTPRTPSSSETQRLAVLPDEMADPPEFVASQFEPGTRPSSSC